MVVFSYLLEKLFENRRYTDSFLSTFDAFDANEQMLDSDAFCASLHRIHEDSSRPLVVFYPDFDMDGIMSGVVGFASLAELGFNVVLYVPDPSDGYGFDAALIDKVMAAYPDAKVLITADTGVTCVDGVARAKELGLEVLVTDHHKPGGILPDANVVVDPMRQDDPYTMPYVCGANVIYMLLQQYAAMYCSNETKSQIQRLRVFAGIGTISDSMPLLYVNRELVRNAVSICRLVYADGQEYVVSNMQGCDVYRSAFYGLWTVLKAFADAGKISSKHDIDESFFGYYLAPMFNSVKRMTGDMTKAFGAFFSSEKQDCVDYLYTLNEERKTVVTEYLSELERVANPMAPYVYLTDAPAGVAGLLATQLMDNTKGPCLVLNQNPDGSLSGSGRSPAWYPFLTQLQACGFPCVAAGHEGAFGIKFFDRASVDAYFSMVQTDLVEQLKDVDLEQFQFRPDFVIDTSGNGDVGIDIVAFLEFLDEVERYKPFGVAFEEPHILLRFRPEEATWQVLGSMKQHLKMILPYGFEVLVWNAADEITRKDSSEPVVLQGRLGINHFRGNDTVQFVGSFAS